MTHKKRKTRQKRNRHTKKIGGMGLFRKKVPLVPIVSPVPIINRPPFPGSTPAKTEKIPPPPTYESIVPKAVKTSVGYSKQNLELAPKVRILNSNQTKEVTPKEVIDTAGTITKKLSIFNFLPVPVYKFIKNSYATIYINKILFNKIYHATHIQKNKYKQQFEAFYDKQNENTIGTLNYSHARCLIYRFFDKNIILNYSYLRESKSTQEICEVTHHIDERVELFNSSYNKNRKHIPKVFDNNEQFTKFYNNKTVMQINDVYEMKKQIREGFKIPNEEKLKMEDENPYDDYSYLILYILNDIHREINLERVKIIKEMEEERKKYVIAEPVNEKNNVVIAYPQRGGTLKIKGGAQIKPLNATVINNNIINSDLDQVSEDGLFQRIMKRKGIDIRLCTHYIEQIPPKCQDFEAVRYAAMTEEDGKVNLLK